MGWRTKRAPKEVVEDGAETCRADVLLITTPSGGRLYVEPVGRLVVGGDGRVDLYSWPALSRLMLILDAGRWQVTTVGGVVLPLKWNERTFQQLVEALLRAA